MSFSNLKHGKINNSKPKATHQLTKINQFPRDPEIVEGIMTCNLGSF